MTRPWGIGTPESYVVTQGDVAYITLTRGQLAIVDSAMLYRITPIKWWAADAHNGFRVAGRVKGRLTYMHRFLTGAVDQKDIVDHINGNELDNRICNLRICTTSDNLCNRHVANKNNSTGARGVSPYYKGRFVARIRKNGKVFRLGYFDTVEEASAARRSAEISMFGDFAPRSYP